MSHLVPAPPLSRLWHHGPSVLAAAGVTLVMLRVPAGGGIGRAVVAVGVLQLALVLSWPIALVFRGYVGAALIGAGAAAAADLIIVRAAADSATGSADPGPLAGDGGLGPLAAVLALALALAFVHQLTRRPPRRDVTDSLAGDTLLVLAVVAASTYLFLVQLTDGSVLLEMSVVAIGAAVVAGHLVDLVLPYPRIVEGVPRGLLGFVVGTGAAMVAAVRLGGADRLADQLGAIILGGVLGGLACLIAIGASYAATERRGVLAAQAAVQAVLPFALVAPVAYLMSILIGADL